MKKRRLQAVSDTPPTIQKAFEQFQKQNAVKNLAQGTIEFYSAKSKPFFLFLEDTGQCIDTVTAEDVEDYILYSKRRVQSAIRLSMSICAWLGRFCIGAWSGTIWNVFPLK